MSDPKPMPRIAVITAGWLIFGCAIAGTALGLSRDLKGHGGPGSDESDVVAPIKTVANATPLLAPPVTEADVRRWAREEMQARAAVVKKAKPDASAAPDDTADPTLAQPPVTLAPVTPVAPTRPANTTAPKSAQQIPF